MNGDKDIAKNDYLWQQLSMIKTKDYDRRQYR